MEQLTTDREFEERLVVEMESIDTLRPMNNQVLLRIDDLHEDGKKLKSGLIIGGTKYNESTYVSRYGTVVKMPSKLTYKGDYLKHRRNDITMSMEWKTTMDIKEGDVCYYGTMAAGSCPVV